MDIDPSKIIRFHDAGATAAFGAVRVLSMLVGGTIAAQPGGLR